jgi:hypothetical protein
MRYPASEKLEIIRIVEQSHLPVRRTLDKLGILPGSFYRWYDRYQSGGVEALADKPSKPSRVWNRIPDDMPKLVSVIPNEPGSHLYAMLRIDNQNTGVSNPHGGNDLSDEVIKAGCVYYVDFVVAPLGVKDSGKNGIASFVFYFVEV